MKIEANIPIQNGLKTVERQFEKNGFWEITRLWSLKKEQGFRVRELVTRSQAEELLAAERAEKDILKADFHDCNAERQRWKDRAEKAEANLEFIERVNGVNEKYSNALAYLEMTEDDDPEEFAECFWNKFIALEADNAAQAARIKELEKINANLMGDDEDKPRYTTKRLKHEIARATEALEAKLAAAEKALEPFAAHANDRAVDDTGWRDKETVKIVVSIGDLRKARAALGGKPS